MNYFNDGLIKKSYILEFTSKSTSKSFVFSVPPQNESFERNFRVNETKTFGGVVVDDYGNDIVNISLSGNTINQEERIVLLDQQQNIIRGSDEITELENIIDEFGKIENLKGKKIVLYSLDNTKKNNYWRVFIKSFSTKRSKDNPLVYTYTLNMTGYPTSLLKEVESSTKLKITPETIKNKFDELSEKIKTGVKYLDAALIGYQKFQEYYEAIESGIEEVSTAITAYSNAINGFISTTANYVKDVTRLGDTIITSAYRCSVGAVISTYQAVGNLVSAVSDCVKWFRTLDNKTEIIGNYINKGFGETTEDIIDSVNYILQNIENSADEMKAATKKQGGTIETLIIPGGAEEDDEVIAVYGNSPVTVKASDTYDSLSKKYFNDASKGKLIASYNKDIALEAGNTIYIPILDKQNLYITDIFNIPGIKDNYGKDIKLTEDGDLFISDNDFKTTEGVETINQAVISRLSSDPRSRIRLNTYGIISQIGSVDLIQNYIVAQVKETLLMDDRVKTVNSVEFEGNGDNISINVDYTDINNNHNNFEGIL